MTNNKNALGTFFIGMMALSIIVSSCTPTPTPSTPTPSTPPTISSISLTSTPALPAVVAANFTPTPDVGSTWTRSTDGMTMVYVPEGNFSMGGTLIEDEKPVHEVYLDAYWIDQTEVTNAMYAQCELAGICNWPGLFSSHTRDSYYRNPQYANYPVIYVDWEQAQAYCQWAGARLPTEAEWEKAASKGDGYLYPWGNSLPGTFLLNSNYTSNDTTTVGNYPHGVSRYGALDMAGNVWEWVADWYSDTYYGSSPSSNPQGPASGLFRVMRGGAWDSLDIQVRSSFRMYNDTRDADKNLGFRCARPGTSSVAAANQGSNPTQTPNPANPTLADFFNRCPTAAEIADVNTRLKITFEGDPNAGMLACTAAAGSADLSPIQKKAYQSIIIMKYLQFDETLPWTKKQLYDWFTNAITGVRFVYIPIDNPIDTPVPDYCCKPPHILVFNYDKNSNLYSKDVWIDGTGVIGPGGSIGAGLSEITGVMIHEARHSDGNYIHSYCPGNPNYLDPNLAYMGASAVQYYFFYWLAYHSDRAFLSAPGFNPNMYRQAAILDANSIRIDSFCYEPTLTPGPLPTISNPYPTGTP